MIADLLRPQHAFIILLIVVVIFAGYRWPELGKALAIASTISCGSNY